MGSPNHLIEFAAIFLLGSTAAAAADPDPTFILSSLSHSAATTATYGKLLRLRTAFDPQEIFQLLQHPASPHLSG